MGVGTEATVRMTDDAGVPDPSPDCNNTGCGDSADAAPVGKDGVFGTGNGRPCACIDVGVDAGAGVGVETKETETGAGVVGVEAAVGVPTREDGGFRPGVASAVKPDDNPGKAGTSEAARPNPAIDKNRKTDQHGQKTIQRKNSKVSWDEQYLEAVIITKSGGRRVHSTKR
jgi:hypothetical protein